MRNMKKYLGLAGLLVAAAVSGCDKNAVQDITTAPPASRVKFFNFGVGTPSVNFYANDTKLTAVVSTITGAESTLGVAQGFAGAGGFYTGITPGQYTLTGKISAATDKDVPISNLPATIADGKFYSYYISGIYNTTAKTADAFVVEDPLPAVDYTVAYVRFVNAISNSNPMVLSAKNTTSGVIVPLGAAIDYKKAGAFTALSGGVYDISTRVAGETTDAITRAGVSFSPGIVYTVGARGDITVTGTTSANRPQLDNTANR